jgi:hypothetical protein
MLLRVADSFTPSVVTDGLMKLDEMELSQLAFVADVEDVPEHITKENFCMHILSKLVTDRFLRSEEDLQNNKKQNSKATPTPTFPGQQLCGA